MLKYIKPFVDLILTLLFWLYYFLGYFVFFSPFYLFAFFFSKNREQSFQRLNHFFLKGLFFLIHILTPGLKIHIQDQVLKIHSSVIVCNHLSYLDPVILIALFKKQKTIVKYSLFKLPGFGWILKTSGYLPSMADESFTPLMIKQIETMGDYLSSGGNLFIFPEGTRTRDGKLGVFNKSAFKIAKRCHAPIKVLLIKNTEILFPPGRFLFNTCIPNTIEFELIAALEPDDTSHSFSTNELVKEVRRKIEIAKNS